MSSEHPNRTAFFQPNRTKLISNPASSLRIRTEYEFFWKKTETKPNRNEKKSIPHIPKWNVKFESNVVHADGGDVYDDSQSQPVTGAFRKGFFMFLFVTMYVVPSAVIIYTCVRIVIALGKPVCAGLERSSAVYRMENNKRKV